MRVDNILHLKSELLCPQIFSGLLVNLPSVMNWLEWLKYFSIPRYGLTVSTDGTFWINYGRCFT